MDWRIKAVVQGTLARVPFGNAINDSLQLRIGGLRNLDLEVAGKVSDWISMVKLLSDSGVSMRDSSMMELGTGWFPAFPVCFWLAGARNCITYDLLRHLKADLIRHCVQSLERHLGDIAQAAGISESSVRDRYSRIDDNVLSSCDITYAAPGDASRTGLPDGCIDILYSNSVLEHVTPIALTNIMQEARRILRPSGVAVHCVACNDHYANFDRSISFVNYLRFSERQWRWWNNSLQYQNRLRAVDFLRLTEEGGLRVIAKQIYCRGGVQEALAQLPIAAEFDMYTSEELLATTVNFVAAPLT